MIRHILETLLGLSITSIGLILAYLFLSDLSSITVLRVFLSAIMIPLGIYFLIKTSRRENKISFENVQVKKNKSLLERNNEKISDYAKTSSLRSKLRALRHL